ncbi:MAG: PAS domain S-box protein [Bacteriovoracaceae bacterium]
MKTKPVILVVDDQIQNIELLEVYLIPEGYEIIKAESGEEALEKLSAHQIDLILLDIIMPGLGGLEVIRRIRQDKKICQLPIIIITVQSETEDRIKGIKAGCDEFLSSPFDKTELLARIQSLLKVKAYDDLMSNYQKKLESEVAKKTDELNHALENLKQDITERKQAEEALYESEQHYRLLVESLPDGVVVHRQGHVVFANRTCATIIGAERSVDLIGKSVMEFVHPDYQKLALHRIQQSLRDGVPIPLMEEKFVRLDGTVIDVEVSAISFPYDGKPAVLTVFNDITERKHAEETILAEKNFSTAIIDSLPGLFYIYDDKGKFLRWNKNVEILSGYSSDEILNMSPLDFFEEPDKTYIAEIIRQVFITGKDATADVDFVSKNRTKTRYSFSGKIFMTEGKPTLIGIAIDIAERKRAEQELLKIRLGIERSSDAIFMTDTVGVIQYVNPAFENIYGYTSNEACGQTPRILKSGKNTLSYYSQLWDTLLSKNAFTAEISNKTKGGSLISVEVSNNPILDKQDNIIGFMGIHRDITLRKQSEEKEKNLESQLNQAQKLESIGTLSSGIAHDFNNILGIILGHTTLLQHLRENPKKLSQSIEAIINATQRGSSLVKQLLTFARKSEVIFETVYINDIITEINILLRETIQKNIVISTSLQQDLPAIVADASQIHQVLLNLCVNARDAMPNGGTLAISSSTIEGEAIKLQFKKITARLYVKIEVVDTGIGMDEATRLRIFEPFFTTKGPGKGTGLGLSTVFGIVEHHSGFIDIRSVLGKGTSCIVYLPIPERSLEELVVVKNDCKEIPGGTETILLIEDEELLRELVNAILVSKGYTILIAVDGVEGVEMYKGHQEQISLVLSDLGLPLLDGSEVFKKIREINS